MLRVLFWNINRKPLAEPLRHLCDIHDIDILVLAESGISDSLLLTALNRDSERLFTKPINYSTRLSFFIRLPEDLFTSVSDPDYCAIRAIDPPLGQQVLLVAIHYPSKLYASDQEQSLLMHRIVEEIREAERRYGHMRTVVVGDLNMNPFEDGVCGSEGLHAVMCKGIAKREARTVHGKKRFFFYNPMWNFLGDETRGPPGTYYYSRGVTTPFWNTFDQVLYRPALLEAYREHDVSIITEIGSRSLLHKGRIADTFSDHLPLIFTVRT
ncbi:endonuclease/exonuclease/phosphatase family protein [uncultured Thiodictyon sp.]|jgi:hypothetical protein|uniref:endonuclease/exonuclease/phosphatase family protein n=1 Tax=uncultured Thiodictyon sp. TaxID=1846217 RepID=UPI0025D2DF4D|nr:endonuclease/exonuclease/phosphatase family protein [uncultured Thiodictyon sp.]